MTESAGEGHVAALKISYPSREAFLEDYDRRLSNGRVVVAVEQPLEPGERVEVQVSFPGLKAPLRLRGTVAEVEKDERGGVRVQVQLAIQTSSRGRLTQQVAQIRSGHTSLIAPVLRVLLVEDNPHMVRLIREGLEASVRRSGQSTDFVLLSVSDGEEALRQLSNGACDLLLCDLYLPVLDGDEVFRRLRADPRYESLPIVAFGGGGEEARRRALSAGADAFLEKPVRLAELLGAVGQAMRARREK